MQGADVEFSFGMVLFWGNGIMATDAWSTKRAEFLSLAETVFDQMLGPASQEDLVTLPSGSSGPAN